MGYKLRWKKGRKSFESVKTFRSKSTAQKKAKFLRQIDDDMPKSKRERYLKTIRAVKAPTVRKIVRGRKK